MHAAGLSRGGEAQRVTRPCLTTAATALVCIIGVMGQTPYAPRPLAAEPPLADGEVLRSDQFPRFLRPTHVGEFGYDAFVVVGDHEALTFERLDLNQDSGIAVETWGRVGTGVVDGRVVSAFRPVWPAERLRETLRMTRWGVDRPFVLWGELVVPGAVGGHRQAVHLRMSPTNIPVSDVTVVRENVQYTSHAVNLWIPDFGDDRIQSGTEEWDLSVVTQRFYEHFADEYETIAIVTQTMHSMEPFHRNVQNAIAGIGLPLFDETALYGSASVLQGVEVYPSGRWAEGPTVLHQQAHQWSDYSRAWAQAGITRQGYLPELHTPLLSPGAVLAGAVLEATRRVSGPDDDGVHVVERTLPMVSYNPLTLYRMGLVSTGGLPIYQVFEDQGQLDPDARTAPIVGTALEGSQVTVIPDDFVAADGVRNGPVVTQMRRALVYVTRTGLASQDEMDVVTYFAARLGATEGVTTWDGYPSFFEATGRRAEMSTGIAPVPASRLPMIAGVADVSYPDVPTDVLVGVELDQPIAGRVNVGQTVTLDGTLTLTDRTDYNIVCFRFIRYGASDVNEVFVCGTLDRIRFSIPVTFGDAQRGAYTIEPFVFWTGSGPQTALSRYGVIVVE